MKDDNKMKESANVEPMSTMHDMKNMPMPAPMPMPMGTMPAQMSMPMGNMPMTMPTQVSPYSAQMPQMPMMCCPFLMNIQCPMLYGQSMMNPMMTGVSPANAGVSPMMNMGDPQMMGQYQYPMGGM